MDNDLKTFHELAQTENTYENLGPEKGNKDYHMKITAYEVGEWEEGRPWLDLMTEVACGESAERRGPKARFSLGESTFEARGKTVTVTAEANAMKLAKVAEAIYGGEIPLTDPRNYDLGEIGQALVEKDFVGSVGTRVDANDRRWDQINYFHNLESPPKGFKCEDMVQEI